MFDANARYIPKGMKFFVSVWSAKEDNELGIKTDDVILCTMLDEENENPRVALHLKTGDVVLTHREDYYDWWLVYAGNKDLTGFLPQEGHIRLKAKKLLEENRL